MNSGEQQDDRSSTAAEQVHEIERLKESSAFLKFMEGKFDLITRREFQDFARVNDYFKEDQIEKRFTRISNQVRQHEDLSELWDLLIGRFG